MKSKEEVVQDQAQSHHRVPNRVKPKGEKDVTRYNLVHLTLYLLDVAKDPSPVSSLR